MSDETRTTDVSHLCDDEIDALHCMGMCADWAGHDACRNEPGLHRFLLACAAGLRWQQDEIIRLRSENVRLGGVVEQPGTGGF